MERDWGMPVFVPVVNRRQFRDHDVAAGLLFHFTNRRQAGRVPTSAQPPGSVQRPSCRSLTSNTRSRSKTAARMSIFGVAWPASFLKRSASAWGSAGPRLSPSFRSRRAVSPHIAHGHRDPCSSQPVLRKRLKTPRPFQPWRILHDIILPSYTAENPA